MQTFLCPLHIMHVKKYIHIALENNSRIKVFKQINQERKINIVRKVKFWEMRKRKIVLFSNKFIKVDIF